MVVGGTGIDRGSGTGSAKTSVHLSACNNNQHILWLCLFRMTVYCVCDTPEVCDNKIFCSKIF